MVSFQPMTQAAEVLPDDPETLKAMLIAERQRGERLIQIIKDLQRHRFGRRAESLPEDQMLLALEDVEQDEAETAAETEAKSPAALVHQTILVDASSSASNLRSRR